MDLAVVKCFKLNKRRQTFLIAEWCLLLFSFCWSWTLKWETSTNHPRPPSIHHIFDRVLGKWRNVKIQGSVGSKWRLLSPPWVIELIWAEPQPTYSEYKKMVCTRSIKRTHNLWIFLALSLEFLNESLFRTRQNCHFKTIKIVIVNTQKNATFEHDKIGKEKA